MKELLGLLVVHNSTELCNNGRKKALRLESPGLLKDDGIKATGISMRLQA